MGYVNKHLLLSEEACELIRNRSKNRFPLERDFVNEAVLTYEERITQEKILREIEKIIGTIEQYLVQTREVLVRIEEDITELKKAGKLEIEKDEAIPSKKVAAKEVGKTL